MYKTNITKEFKNKGLYDPELGKLISTNKATEGETFDIAEALKKIGAGGVEVSIAITQKDVIEDVEESE
ncbi:hypothetical protein JOC34_000467 [Virgibacillus halotolerans]|uniref:hypothetical protein n=1 Tax=Virgibacillus halotolerans TaxID=1071053 RepID=UPI00196222C5|nr:hypothetical protein [Virgibacillus halotolerans]MBM7598110.1 hypothetical protein [Virgibacillus halotolerans]